MLHGGTALFIILAFLVYLFLFFPQMEQKKPKYKYHNRGRKIQ